MVARTGQGTTVAIATNTYDAKITSISSSGYERPVLDTTDLTTTGTRSKLPGELIEPLQISCEIFFDPNQLDDLATAIAADATTVTIQWPLHAAEATLGAKITGTGCLINHSFSVGVDEMMTGSFTIQFLGAITPADGS